MTCTATYTATQADADAGSVINTATATATPPAGDTPPTSEPSTATVAITPGPALTVVKSATPSDPVNFTVGQVITYSFLITNAGNVTLTDVRPTEGTFTGSGTMSAPTCPAGAASLAPGASVTCTATYTLTQADVDAGHVTNAASATGTPPAGDTTPVAPSSTVTIPGTPNPAITVAKTATPSTLTAAGQTVVYSFLVTNTGNVTLTDVHPTETAFSGTGTAPTITCPAGAASLAPGASVTCTATYTATQADADAGTVTNTATATGTPPAGDTTPVSEPSTATVTITPNPAITVVKSAAPISSARAGQTVTYSFLVTNTGNVTLTGVHPVEGVFTGTGTLSAPVCPTGTASLAPGAQMVCTAAYVLSQADINSGAISNTATATGTPPGESTPPVSPPSTVTVPLPPAPAITVVKSASPADAASFKVGEKITYSFVVTNTGNVTLTDVHPSEGTFSGSGTMSAPVCPAGAASLAPGASVTCTAGYTVTQADVDAGKITNVATATGTPPTSTPPVSPPSKVTVPNDPKPALSVLKSASLTTITGAGQKVGYSFLVTNTGNVTLTNVTVSDAGFSGTGPLSPVTCPAAAAKMLPGASITCTASYTTTQADVDAGKLVNTATAGATPPGGGTVTSPPSKVTVTVSKLGLVKTANAIDSNRDGRIDAGDQIAWTLVVTNQGTTTVGDVVVSDPTAGAVTCPASTLTAGESMSCTAPNHTITEADAAAGTVDNTAVATGTGVTTQVQSAHAHASVPVQPAPIAPTPDPPLAYTGAPALPQLLGAAALLLLLGASTTLAARRRRRI
ncbi:conserved repeat domain-containing protein [Nakamurella panacisegetis]|uniref:Conserved repeat domain-containing protein n=1 Tax=Nakamurella panacisegetis TaxID=1090615 RepID=A0A1H0LJV9_9ACTN|nr:DUF11 domain-containing protein [Nakamurella panacisegetis]SDO68316.1 conserved repeat domain-containing protein [Nakamurella panacisegetis]